MGIGDGGRGHNGGVWEWTSTVFDKHEDFKPSTLYPGFSADFFDNLHNVVVRDILSMVFFFSHAHSRESTQRLVGPTPRLPVKQDDAHCVTFSSAIIPTHGTAVELCMMWLSKP